MGLLMERVPGEILRDRVKSTEEFLLTKRGHFLLRDQRKGSKKRTQSWSWALITRECLQIQVTESATGSV